MILVDTSVWIDHLRANEATLVTLLERNDVLVHPWVTGELALGNMKNRDETLSLLSSMPQAPVVTHEEVLALIASENLHGLGIGLVDVQLVASAHATPETLLWTRDRRLGAVVARLGLRFDDSTPTPSVER